MGNKRLDAENSKLDRPLDEIKPADYEIPNHIFPAAVLGTRPLTCQKLNAASPVQPVRCRITGSMIAAPTIAVIGELSTRTLIWIASFAGKHFCTQFLDSGWRCRLYNVGLHRGHGESAIAGGRDLISVASCPNRPNFRPVWRGFRGPSLSFKPNGVRSSSVRPSEASHDSESHSANRFRSRV